MMVIKVFLQRNGRSGANGQRALKHVVLEVCFATEPLALYQIYVLRNLRVKLKSAILPYVVSCNHNKISQRIFFYSAGLSEWSGWGACTKTCGTGQQYRKKSCNYRYDENENHYYKDHSFYLEFCSVNRGPWDSRVCNTDICCKSKVVTDLS